MSFFLHFVLGGSRSGKSAFAEKLASESNWPVVYIATYATTAVDQEMLDRVAQHRQRRPKNWKTVENRFDLKTILTENQRSLILLDSLTLWISYKQVTETDEAILSELKMALTFAEAVGISLIIVSDELGGGLVPSSIEARRFRDLMGLANQVAAKYSNRTDLIVAGLPLNLKGHR